MAQELPEILVRDDGNGVLHFDVAGVLATAIASIQELSAQVTDLQNQVDALKPKK